MVYEGLDNRMHSEMVTALSDENYAINSKTERLSSGTVIVEDWQGNFIKGYIYSNGETHAVSPPSRNLSSAKVVCITTDWYTCYANTEGGQTCTYNYTETICADDGGGSAGDDDGGTSGGDYGGGGSGDNTENGDNSVPDFSLAQNYNRLCGTIYFTEVNHSYTAEIIGLGLFAMNANGQQFNVELGVDCVSIPSYSLTPYDASEIFKQEFRNAVNQIMASLNNGTLSPNATLVRTELITLIRANLSMSRPGSSFSSGPCFGNIAQNQASYC